MSKDSPPFPVPGEAHQPPPPLGMQPPPPSAWPPPPAAGFQSPPPVSSQQPRPPSSYAPPTKPGGQVIPEGNKSFIVTLVLSVMFGFFGADRFYLGKTGTALAKLLTFGGFGYWWLIDIIITLFGGQRDSLGLRLEGYGRARNQLRRNGSKPVPIQTVQNPSYMPDEVREQLEGLANLRRPYGSNAAAGDRDSAVICRGLDSLMNHAEELFRRLVLKSDEADLASATLEYEDKLSTIRAALDRDYLLDVIANPQLWDNSQGRIRDVLTAIKQVDEQLLRNIKQVNANSALVFEVALDGTLGSHRQMDNWQSEFDKMSGKDGP